MSTMIYSGKTKYDIYVTYLEDGESKTEKFIEAVDEFSVEVGIQGFTLAWKKDGEYFEEDFTNNMDVKVLQSDSKSEKSDLIRLSFYDGTSVVLPSDWLVYDTTWKEFKKVRDVSKNDVLKAYTDKRTVSSVEDLGRETFTDVEDAETDKSETDSEDSGETVPVICESCLDRYVRHIVHEELANHFVAFGLGMFDVVCNYDENEED